MNEPIKAKRIKAYKLLKIREDGTIGSLFINKTQVIPLNKWLQAEDHPTKGYAHRPGWHVCLDAVAPHLTMKGRVWCEVEVEDYYALKRPEFQGTTWILANRMRVLRLTDIKHDNPFNKE